MMDSPLVRRQRAALHELTRLAAERAAAEAEAAAGFQARKEVSERDYEEARQRSAAALEAERTATEQEYVRVRQQVTRRFDADHQTTEKEYNSVRHRLSADFDGDRLKAEKKHQETAWQVTTIFEASKTHTEEHLQEVRLKTDAGLTRTQEVEQEAIQLLEDAGLDPAFEKQPCQRPSGEEEPLHTLKALLATASDNLQGLRGLRLRKLFTGERFLCIVLALWFAGVALIAAVLGVLVLLHKVEVYASGWPKNWYLWPIGWTVAVGLAALTARLALAARLRRQVEGFYPPLRQALADAVTLCKQTRKETEENYPRMQAENERKHQRDLRQVDEKFTNKVKEMQQTLAAALHEADQTYPRLLTEIRQRFDHDIHEAEEKYPRLLGEIKRRHEAEMQQARDHCEAQTAANDLRHRDEWNVLAERWRQGLTQVQAEVAALQHECGRLFPEWSFIDSNDWTAPEAVPGGMRFGELEFRMDQVPHAVPDDERLHDARPSDFPLPALVPFPQRGSVLLKASDAGRAEAVRVLQALMLRFLTSLPPGKVRFTIIDPVGLGENFASFMHLADYQEALVTNRIWTEAAHVEQRLADLTEHMETVIQKYLRNEFATLEDYNAQAGEIAEPYRVLVAANFPVNFTEAAARRLLSIAAGGARSGVYTLVSVDTKLPLPQGFHLKDLEQLSLNLAWKEQRFAWRDADFGKFPLRLDAPTADEVCTHILHKVGAKARDAGRVEVPFEFIAPRSEQYWTDDTRKGLRVALGRAGATKLQYLQLGQGTSQHVLIAGKTGSGKSTLLHALVTNTALHYSPDEVEFYLIDFKKGVEFKTYAAHELPHARVVAIESDREFGLSVLQRLDAELRQRGELFRTAGVQDLNGYRQANGAAPLPRILLVVDEFQEFFTEDDKIAQDVSLLLDRLVRQGRAFGIHVLLGSQTLGGAYSLARSTLGQMAVRIALQCSEADAHLILSEENAAARLLSRPGEAIYNDANGLAEGNNFFQVVWLPEERREVYLERVRDLARARRCPPRPQIVFEGNAPADVRKNHLLQRCLQEAAPAARAFHAWLGDPMAIKDPTAAVFRPQSGSNLLVIGQ
jgi:hypothetical protein